MSNSFGKFSSCLGNQSKVTDNKKKKEKKMIFDLALMWSNTDQQQFVSMYPNAPELFH